jgi:hypothetical protein
MLEQFNTLKDMIRSGQNSHDAIQQFLETVREDYSAQVGSLKLSYALRGAALKLAMQYSECGYADAPDSFDTIFGTLDTLIEEAEASIVIEEARDILIAGYANLHPDAEGD